MRTAAVLPVKRFERAKQRLAGALVDGPRVELARAMVADVLLALGQTASIEQTIVVTCEESVGGPALHAGATVVQDTAESGQPAAVALGVRRAIDEGFERVLCVPGDCPALDPGELERLLAGQGAPGRAQVIVLPDRHGTGTNGLLLTPPDAIPPAFGPGSCERHRALAAAAGAECRIERLPSLLLDVDTGEDLAVLRERLSEHRARAMRTRAALGLAGDAGAVSITASA